MSRIPIIVGNLLLFCLLSGCAAESGEPMPARLPPAPAPSVRYSDVRPDDLIPPAPGDYRVQPGDVLELKFGDLVGPGIETVKVVRVSGTGTISLPLLGPIHVAGMTEAEINEAIDDEYRRFNF
jgi:protein involved in polysaccharide export with SLBB domain